MKPLRPISTPTRNRRVNEMLGLIVLVAAALLLLALASYTPSDPSLDTVGAVASGSSPAHNWTGIAGAYLSDAMLQMLGVAAFFLPLLLVRTGVCWMRSRPSGSPLAKWLGFALWVVFAPAAVALLPGMLWRKSLPASGLSGRLVADALIHILNVPGTAIVVSLMVALSLYLASTFSFETAREWMTEHFRFVAWMRERWMQFRMKRRPGVPAEMLDEQGEVYGARREKLDAEARRERELMERAARNDGSNTLLGGFLHWFSRFRRSERATVTAADEAADAAPLSIWQAMPRTNVDAAPATPLSMAAAAAAPYAQALAAAAAPLPLQPDELDEPELHAPMQPRLIAEEEPFAFVTRKESERQRLKPESGAGAFSTAEAMPLSKTETFTATAEAYAGLPAQAEPKFGKRADSDLKTVAITAKSVRGYKLPSSSLLYKSEDQSVVREDAAAPEEARTLVAKMRRVRR